MKIIPSVLFAAAFSILAANASYASSVVANYEKASGKSAIGGAAKSNSASISGTDVRPKHSPRHPGGTGSK